jgi:hypothetical protein
MTAALQAMAEYEKSIRGSRPHSPAPAQAKTVTTAKPIYHYLLLPTFEWGVSDWHWTAVLQYVNRFQPTCGFSATEALAADYVTLVGNEQGLSAEVEQTLRAAGCQVERICGHDGVETQQRLNDMAAAGQRFLNVQKPDIPNSNSKIQTPERAQ